MPKETPKTSTPAVVNQAPAQTVITTEPGADIVIGSTEPQTDTFVDNVTTVDVIEKPADANAIVIGTSTANEVAVVIDMQDVNNYDPSLVTVEANYGAGFKGKKYMEHGKKYQVSKETAIELAKQGHKIVK